MMRKKLFILILLIFGFFFRIAIASQWNVGLVWDSLYYSSTANAILSGIHTANCCNISAGYPFIVALFYRLFGTDNVLMVKIFQAALDTVTAFLVYKTAQKLKPQAAIFAFVLYIFNPLTASYAGVVLTEVTSFFLIALSVFILTRSGFEKRPVLWLLFGVSLGYLTFTKPAFYMFSLGTIGTLAVFKFRSIQLVKFLFVSMVGFFVVSLYSIVTIYRTFNVFSVVPPYRSMYGSLYTSFYLERSGEMEKEPVTIHPEYSDFIQGYLKLYNYNPAELPRFDVQYKPKFYEKMKTDWPIFVENWFRNSIWTWDKYHLGVYKDPWYPGDSMAIRVGNILLLFFHAVGFVIYSFRKRTLFQPIQIFTGLLFLFIIGTFCMINNETRLSMPYYPLVFIWAGYAISEGIGAWKKLTLRQAQGFGKS